MKRILFTRAAMLPLALLPALAIAGEQFQISGDAVGRVGGRLVAAQRTEPKTLNPIYALDVVSREMAGLMTSDLIHIDRGTDRPVPALAASWTVSKDQRTYTLHLRRGLKFSDGHPFDADDVMFTFRVHLDERTKSNQRALLTIDERVIEVRKLDASTVVFQLPRPYPAAERLFDSIAILPRHLLEDAYREGTLMSRWGVMTPPAQLAGLGPFRLKQYVPGERMVFERNPFYWKLDKNSVRLPYLDELVFQFVGNEDAQVIRFRAGESHVISGLSPAHFSTLAKDQRAGGYRLADLGPGLEYSFLLFNLNDLHDRKLPEIASKQAWFRQRLFRQAVSAAVDRDAIVRMAYQGKAASIWSHVSQANRTWINRDVPKPPRSLDRARQLLKEAGFSWNAAGRLMDPAQKEVRFSILTSAGNPQRAQIATVIQDDLKMLGMDVAIVSLEFRAMLDRVFQSHEYEAAVMTLASGDTDPNSDMNVWAANGSTHLWRLKGAPTESWEIEIDRLMRQQMLTTDPAARKRLYDRVQYLVAENLPLICVLSPHVVVGATTRLGNFKPSVLRPYALWNADQLYFSETTVAAK